MTKNAYEIQMAVIYPIKLILNKMIQQPVVWRLDEPYYTQHAFGFSWTILFFSLSNLLDIFVTEKCFSKKGVSLWPCSEKFFLLPYHPWHCAVECLLVLFQEEICLRLALPLLLPCSWPFVIISVFPPYTMLNSLFFSQMHSLLCMDAFLLWWSQTLLVWLFKNELKFCKIMFWRSQGMGDGPVSKALTTQKWRPKFNPQKPSEILAWWCTIEIPALGRWRQLDPGSSLASQASLTSRTKGSVRRLK